MNAILLLGLFLAGGEPELIEVGALLRPTPESVSRRLGLFPLWCSGIGGWYPDSPRTDHEHDETWIVGVVEEAERSSTLGLTLEGGCLVVPAESAPRIRRAVAGLAADLLRTVRVRIEVRFPDGAVERGEVATRDGHWTSFGVTTLRRFHADNDVELACSISAQGAPSVISDPIVTTVREGLAVDVRPFLLGDGDAVALEVVAQAGRIDPETPTLPLESRFHGRIQLPRYRGVVATVSGRVEPGKALEARLEGPDGTYVIRLMPTAEGTPGSGAIRLPPTGLESTCGAPLRVEVEEEGQWEAWSRLEGLAGPIHGGGRPPEPPDEAITGSPELTRVKVGETAERLAPLARTVRLELTLRAGDVVVGRARVSALAGRTAVARIGRHRMVVADWDVEVGCYNQIGDPIVTPVFTGALVRLRPHLSPDGRTILLDLTMRHLETEVGAPPSSGSAVTGPIHPVRVAERTVSTDLAFPDGGKARVPLGPLTLHIEGRSSLAH